MGTLYLRKVILTVTGNGSLEVNGNLSAVNDLKIGFNVSKSVSSKSNTAEIEVTNLSDKTRRALKDEYTRIRLEAGYQGRIGSRGSVGLIFDGHIRDVEHRRDGADIISRIECGDGDKALRTGVIAKTWPAGTKPKAIVEDIHAEMEDVDLGTIQGLDDLPAYRRPVTMVAPVHRGLDEIARSHGLLWSVQDGRLEMIPADGYLDEVVMISPSSGMIGVPTITDNGVKVSCLLNPQIRPNRVIEVQSEMLDMNGVAANRFRVSAVTFSGDNRDGDFTADVTGEAINDGRIPRV